jgi:UPF0271 protein
MDINCDLGEGMAHDRLIMPYITRCNIACGAHAGSKDLIIKTIQIAQEYGVEIGAHPSYPDRENFGRISMKMDITELKQSMKRQLEMFLEAAELCGAKMSHVKPHGALYHDVANKPDIAQAFLEVIDELYPEIILITSVNSVLFNNSTTLNHILWPESFIDRSYRSDLTLVPRQEDNSIIHDPKIAQQQFLNLRKGRVQSVDGKLLDIQTMTCCIHSDHPNSLEIAKAISAVN